MELGFSYDCKWSDNSSMSGTNETLNSLTSFSLATGSSSHGSSSWASQAGWIPDTPPSSSNSISGTSGRNDMIDWTDDLISSIDEVLQASECQDVLTENTYSSGNNKSSPSSSVDKYSTTNINYSPTTSTVIKYSQTEKKYKQAEKPGNRGSLGQFQFQDEQGLEFKVKGRICEEKKVKMHFIKETVNEFYELCSFNKKPFLTMMQIFVH